MFEFLGGGGMGDIMKLLAPLMAPGSPKDKAVKITKTLATDENIKKATTAIIEGFGELQNTSQTRYVLYTESTQDKKDVIVNILIRDPVTLQLTPEPFCSFYLSQITQEQILSLINLFFNNVGSTATTNATKQLRSGE